jgi:indole-3-glycerol phosphate synthase
LEAVRAVVDVPVLRKDFVRHPVQLFEARAHGADAALLIVRIVDDAQLLDLYQTAREIGLGVLVEIHSAREADRAMRLDPAVVGVNNRDLDTFETRLEFSREMASAVGGRVRVSESGIASAADLAAVKSWGYQAVLVGESLMRDSRLLGEWTHGNAH